MEQASLLVSVLQNGCWRRDSYFLTDQTLQPLISLQLHLEKGSTRYFKKQQWIMKSLVRYSVSKTSVICLTISPPQAKKATSLTHWATLIDLKVVKTLHKTRSGFTEEARLVSEEVERDFTCLCFLVTLMALLENKFDSHSSWCCYFLCVGWPFRL